MSVYLIDDTAISAEMMSSLQVIPQLDVLAVEDMGQIPAYALVIADVSLFLQYLWPNPTIVLADATQAEALALAWQRGALAGWMRHAIPAQADEVIEQIRYQYQRQQDSRDLPSAVKLQQALLPDPLQLDGYQLHHFYQPAAFLSGDWIDYWKVDEQHVLFYLADVAGHGVASSLLSAWLAAFHGHDGRPEDLLNDMNRLLVQQNTGKHITLLCGLLDQQRHQVHWCSAGHYPPAILIQPNQPPEILTASSFPLGLTAQLNIQMQTIDLPPDSQLIFASDGALEAFQGNLGQQLNQLIEQLSSQQFHPPVDLPDDLALLCLSRLSNTDLA
ncbi:MAG: SpoIIE family protein phosphatase [Pseudomonadota bacterium]|nr:SpoIIE family protein phosphatase [Pseudomonadota bacterium]